MIESKSKTELDQLCVNTIRTLSIDGVQAAESGHPGMPMGMADVAYVLWTKFLKFNPKDPNWYDRDRFILSAGHGSMLLYSLLHLTGFDLSLEELKNFRQWGSKTPGHPEYGLTPGVETTTGPLGQGFGTGIGMAMAEAFMAEKFNTDKHTITDHYTYAIVSDGDLMEGISHEAASLAGHLKLGKVIYLYDSNHITIDGSTDLAYSDDVQQRFSSYNWHVQEINGHNHGEIEDAISKAQDAGNRPSIIICNTHIGYGSPHKQDSSSSHGAPLGEDEVKLTKEEYGWDPDKKFYIPDEALKHFREVGAKGVDKQAEWQQTFDSYKNENAEKAAEFENFIDRKLPDHWEDILPTFDADPNGTATRKASNKVLNAIKDPIPHLIGGSADLAASNKTDLDDEGSFSAENYGGRNLHFGVREHGMGAIVNGLALHGGVIPYGATFLIFTDYCRPALRIAALSKIPSIFVMTHDSIGLGEDGPTHQPIEHLASLRAMPNLTVLRPADANEVSYAWKAAIENTEGPTLLVLTRQSIPIFERNEDNAAANTEKGAYILSDAEKDEPDALLLATGSEAQIAMKAQEKLRADDIDARVISMPSWELFEKQPKDYREKVIPSSVKARVSVEAASTFGWAKWNGSDGYAIGVDRFGASAPYQEIYDHFGITVDRMVEKTKEILNR